MNMDKLTSRAFLGLDILTTKYEIRTSLGAIVGIILVAICNIFEKNIEENFGFNFSFIGYTGTFFLGILFLHIPTYINSFRGKAIDEDYESILRTIDSANELSEIEKRDLKRKLILKKIDSLSEHELKKKAEEAE
ncbi:hypothetical protein PAFU01_11200 [Pantoea ananatis]|nr:hypothetical protein PAFU01_11200 [Pantoea ananatis]